MLREIISNEWYTALIVLCLCLLALAKLVNPMRFASFLGVLGTSKYLKIYSREKKSIDRFELLLFLNVIISGSIFLLISYSTLVEPLTFDIILFLKTALAIAIVIIIKVFLERIIANLFAIPSIIEVYLFQKISYKHYLGLLLVPINIVLLFAMEPNSMILFVIFGVLILINLIGIITSIKTNQKIILHNFFYFILYLCALEIGPYIILYKLFTDS